MLLLPRPSARRRRMERSPNRPSSRCRPPLPAPIPNARRWRRPFVQQRFSEPRSGVARIHPSCEPIKSPMEGSSSTRAIRSCSARSTQSIAERSTAPGTSQAVVSFSQCKESEDAMWDMGFPGSAVLVEEVAGRYRAIDYEPDVNLGDCAQDRRADGRDVLLCRSGLAAPPSGAVSFVFLLDFARVAVGGSHSVSLVKLFSDSWYCSMINQFVPAGLVSLEVGRMSLSDLNHDGTGDLVLKIQRSRIPASPSFENQLRARCKKKPGETGVRELLPRAKETRFRIPERGRRLHSVRRDAEDDRQVGSRVAGKLQRPRGSRSPALDPLSGASAAQGLQQRRRRVSE